MEKNRIRLSEQAAELLRLLTPMVNKKAAQSGMYLVRESMKQIDGLGYIGDTLMPKLMRNTMVLLIWEVAGNCRI